MDFIERADGPPLVALWGSDGQDSPFRLGTRELDWHSHVRGQVFCVESGLVHVRTSHGSWLLPPHRAGWIPPGERHWASVSGAVTGWSVVVAPKESLQLPDKPCVVGISELLRALVRRAVSWTEQLHLDPLQQRIIQVLLDEIRQAPHQPLHLPMPFDPRLVRIATALFERPGDARTLEEWAAWAAISTRTLRRLMQAETGLSFSEWRQQARLAHALELLARREPVASISDALGYASPSNFIAMFRRAFGDSPAHYFAMRAKVSFDQEAASF